MRRRWWAVLVLAAAGLLLAGCAPSGQTRTWPDSPLESKLQAACAGDPTPRVKAVVDVIGPTQDQKYDIAALTRLLNIANRPGMEKYTYTVGLTQADLNVETELDTQSMGYGSRWCGKVIAATVRINWPIEVHVASELKPGTCVYRTTVDHEDQHVALDRKLLPELQERFEEAVADAFDETFWASSKLAVRKAVQDRMHQVARSIIKDFQSERDARQLELDTPEEYERQDKLCSDDEWRAVLPK